MLPFYQHPPSFRITPPAPLALATKYVGPFAGGIHEFMKNASLKLPIPNPHQGDISLPLLKRILQKAGISEAEWEQI
jgi:hypothetical protein